MVFMSLLKRLTGSRLVRGSFLIFIGNNIAGLGNFLYNLLMARFLSPEIYGDLGAVFSVLILLGVPLGILNLLVVKSVSVYWGKKEKERIRAMLACLTPRLFIAGIIFCIVILLVSRNLSQFLNLENSLPMAIIALFFILSCPTVLNRAILQGTLSFQYLTINTVVEISLKLIVSVVLVVLNLKLTGALLGPLIGGVAAYLLTFWQMRLIFENIKRQRKYKKLLSSFYIPPVFFTSFALTLLFTMDMILVRHFFPSRVAGEYAALSTIGKIIYYIIGPVIGVMFPLVSSRKSSGLPYLMPLMGSLVISLGLSTIIISGYFLFPKLIVGLLFGSKYYGVIPYLGIFSFYISLYSINAILTYFLLSVSYYLPIYVLFGVSCLQGLLIFFLHSSIAQVIWINILVSIVYLIFALYFVWNKEEKLIKKMVIGLLPGGLYGG